MPDAIFISYRRDDSEGEAGRLFDDLTRVFGPENVFMDVAGIQPGADFRKAIESSVANCGVLLAVIGPIWATLSDANGQRRLEAPNDYVALEIANALARDIPVIPVLVHDARMPQPGQLPDALKLLAYRNSIELSHTRWSSDIQLLIAALKRYAKPLESADVPAPPTPAPPAQRVAAAQRLPVTARAATAAPPSPPASNRGTIIGLSFAGLAIAGLFFAMATKAPVRPGTQPNNTASMPTPALGTPPMPPDSVGPQAAQPAPAADTAQKPSLQNASDQTSQGGKPGTPSTNPPATSTAAASPTPASNIASLAGEWMDSVRRGGDSLDRVVIRPVEAGLALHAFGWCPPKQCDWGIQPASVKDNIISADFFPVETGAKDYLSRKASVKLRPDGNSLDVFIENTFMTSTGFRTNQIHRTFVRAPKQ